MIHAIHMGEERPDPYLIIGFGGTVNADLNTSVNFDESCDVCHKEGAEFSVDRVHAQ